MKDEPSRLPPSQSPFITLLQKNRGELIMVEVLEAEKTRNPYKTNPIINFKFECCDIIIE